MKKHTVLHEEHTLIWYTKLKKNSIPRRNPLSTSSEGNIPTHFVLMFCPFHHETSGLQMANKRRKSGRNSHDTDDTSAHTQTMHQKVTLKQSFTIRPTWPQAM